MSSAEPTVAQFSQRELATLIANALFAHMPCGGPPPLQPGELGGLPIDVQDGLLDAAEVAMRYFTDRLAASGLPTELVQAPEQGTLQ